jgi:hypothetical protein
MIFELISSVTDNKTSWDALGESAHKDWNSYIINRFLSMNFHLTESVNDFQMYSPMMADKRMYHTFLRHVLPEKRLYFKYMKSTNRIEISSEFVDILRNHYQCGRRAIYELIEVMSHVGFDEIISVISLYGLQPEKIEQLKTELDKILVKKKNTN